MALRMWPSVAAVHACSFWILAPPDRRRPTDRRRHSSIANRLPCAAANRSRLLARRGRPERGSVPMADIREDHSMKLLTEAQRTKLLANGTRRGADHAPVVKWFNPCGAGTWLLSELDPEYPDECGFGLADLGFGTPGLGIERDIHFQFTPKLRAPPDISSNRDPNSKSLPASSPVSPPSPQLRQNRQTGRDGREP